MFGKKQVSYDKFKTAVENDIMNRFPAISQHIHSINIDKNHFSADLRGAGLGIAKDSRVCSKEASVPNFLLYDLQFEQYKSGCSSFVDDNLLF